MSSTFNKFRRLNIGSVCELYFAHVIRDAQSTEKSVFYGFSSLVSVYGQKNDLWPNLRIFSRLRYSTEKIRFSDESTDFFVLSPATTPPPPTLDSRYFARAE